MRAGSGGGTTRTSRIDAIWVMPAKSLTGSIVSPLLRAPITVWPFEVTIDATDRKAAIFQFEIPASSFKPGLYACQINIIDVGSGKFAFPRLAFYVR